MEDVDLARMRDLVFFVLLLLLASVFAGENPIAAYCSVLLAVIFLVRYFSERFRTLWSDHPTAFGLLEALIALVAILDLFFGIPV